MNTIPKSFALATCVAAMVYAAATPKAAFNIEFVPDAEAGIIVAPVRRTVVATSVVASSSANASAAAAANASASATAAASASAAAAASAPTPTNAAAGPPPVGTTVTTLPPGCAPVKLNDVDYMRCGSTYYTAAMMGTTVVFVVAQP